MVFLFVEFPRARELWIPAFAGMTDDGVDSRLRGNDGVFLSGIRIRGKESRAGMSCSCGNINTAVFFPGINNNDLLISAPNTAVCQCTF